jgi:hypothetical protein
MSVALLDQSAEPSRECERPVDCGGEDGLDESRICVTCRRLREWQRIQRQKLQERERLVPALRELEALCKHFPNQVASMLLTPALAERIAAIAAHVGVTR